MPFPEVGDHKKSTFGEKDVPFRFKHILCACGVEEHSCLVGGWEFGSGAEEILGQEMQICESPAL